MLGRDCKSIVQSDDISCNDVLCSLLGLNSTQISAYAAISKAAMDVNEVAGRVGRDRSSVQKTLQELISAGLASRRHLPAKRGRKFAYIGIGPRRLRSRLDKELDEYCRLMRAKIRRM
jgi:predicted transcriptional regulator